MNCLDHKMARKRALQMWRATRAEQAWSMPNSSPIGGEKQQNDLMQGAGDLMLPQWCDLLLLINWIL